MSKTLVLNDNGQIDSALIGELLDQVERDGNAAKNAKTQEQKLRDTITHMLGQLGGLTVQDDALTFEGEKIILPAQYRGKVESAIDFLRNYIKQQEQPFEFSRVMDYRPYDGAHAFMTTMKRITGTTGFGVTKMTFFGPQLPQFLSVNTDVNTVVQVPWGTVAFPTYQAEFEVGFTRDRDKGILFSLGVTAPRKWRKHIEAIFALVEKEVKENSIYRGKAINGSEMPEFIDLSGVDPSTVVYSQDVLDQLGAHVWAPIRYSEQMRSLNIPLKRAIIFAGPYGTGKSLGCMLTAQEAVAQGWTFVMCRTGKDNPAEVMKTAELYAPAVVVIEDIDVHAEGSSNMDVSRLLEMLDGITSKGKEVIGLFTTNHLSRIQKGALRPGRVDAVIEIKGLDTQAFRKLVEINIGQEFLAGEVDWEAVAESMKGFLPAFVVEATRRTHRFTMARNNGVPSIVTTEDLIHAAESLRPQLELMDGAKEGVSVRTIEDILREQQENLLGRSRLDSGSLKFLVEEASKLNGAIH